MLNAPTRDERVLRTALAEAPEIAYGTQINDALMKSLKLLREARLSAG